ncbi:MAG TPA: hypothetical protein DCM10_00940, partial [Xanthomarina gelatinilytica]|nr:hypothetical protein [Xanthomarina gelatinilytica]
MMFIKFCFVFLGVNQSLFFMKNTTLKQLFMLTVTLFVTSVYAQTTRESYLPTEVEKVLEKVQSVSNMAVREPANLLSKE